MPIPLSVSTLAAPTPAAAAPAADTDRHVSRAIRVARVLSIAGIVYVHAWTGLGTQALNRQAQTPQGLLRWMLIELLGLSAVPLLSVVSGWLVGPSLAKRGSPAFLAGKARTVLLPMVLWNALAVLLVSGAARAGWIHAPEPHSLADLADELLCLIHPAQIDVQMPFLRDLFLCMLAAPWLVRRSDGVLCAIALGALAWMVAPIDIPVLLRPSILAFFIAGLLVRRHGLAARLGRRPVVLGAIPYLVLAGTRLWLQVAVPAAQDHPMLLGSLDLVMRLATALFFWSLAWRLAASRAAPLLLRVEPWMFLTFCAHLILIWLAGPAIGGLTGPMGSRFYPLLLLLQPPLAIAATMALGRLLLMLGAGQAIALLSGGRIGAAAPAPR